MVFLFGHHVYKITLCANWFCALYLICGGQNRPALLGVKKGCWWLVVACKLPWPSVVSKYDQFFRKLPGHMAVLQSHWSCSRWAVWFTPSRRFVSYLRGSNRYSSNIFLIKFVSLGSGNTRKHVSMNIRIGRFTQCFPVLPHGSRNILLPETTLSRVAKLETIVEKYARCKCFWKHVARKICCGEHMFPQCFPVLPRGSMFLPWSSCCCNMFPRFARRNEGNMLMLPLAHQRNVIKGNTQLDLWGVVNLSEPPRPMLSPLLSGNFFANT